AYTILNYTYGKKYPNAINVAAGKRVFQFNNYSTQGERGATLSALFFENNRRKIYEAWFVRVKYEKGFGTGFNGNISLQYQDRMPLSNTTDFTFFDKENKEFTPNYPEQFIGPAFTRHQAVIGAIGFTWQPGNRYIEFPDRKISIGSKYPSFSFTYLKGVNNIFGSDVDYDKWRFNIAGDFNLKLAGRFNYQFSTGGFFNANKIQIPDYFHLNGNQSTLATAYLSSFQLLPHYKYSNTKNLFSTAFLEHHFNGFLTNKIPGFKKLNWHLVAGSNAFYADKDLYYFEVFGGIENIFKIIRVDFVQGYLNGKKNTSGLRIGIQGITGGKVED
ncbi:MAG: DUF5686 family protein, partial [Bacteroidota bacterium]|nr:DUF5686 family protein [Bacteroidota bacterium]